MATDPPLVTRNIPELALRGAELFGDRSALVDGPVDLSFHDLRREMLTIASSLIARGVQPGERIALWAPNSAAWVTSALGIMASGAVLVPLNTRFTSGEVANLLEMVDASLLFVADGFLGKHQVEGLRAEAPTLRSVADPILVPTPGSITRPEWQDFIDQAQGDPITPALDRIGKIGPDDVSDIIFSSGTTGAPKGVLLLHGTSVRLYTAYNEIVDVREGDRMLVSLPFFHCFGYKAGWMLDLLAGATTYPLAVFDGPTVLEMIQKYKITHLPGSPSMLWPLVEDPNRQDFDLSSLRTVVLGAAPIPVELVRRLQDEIHVENVMSGYGLTENHALVSMSRRGDAPELVATTVGRVVDELEVRTVDDDGHPLPTGATGEFVVRGYGHMVGYYGDPAATAAVLSDGWLHTGDVGNVDEQGYLRITDRKKDIYITGGFNVAPAEVEKVIATLDGVSRVAVVGVSDDRMGEVGAAFVVPVEGSALSPDGILTAVRGRVANYKVPRYVHIVSELPTNAMGKIQKAQLRLEHDRTQADAARA
jgi:acyl-CoA synthetase (AMP-forming)/AMP-acid ligase II